MRLLSLLPTVLLACTGAPADSGTPADTDTDTDADTDADSDADDTAPAPVGVINGTVVAHDGPVGVDVEVQACVTTCYSTQTDSAGAFSYTGMEDGEYKLDVVGEGVDDKDYGRIRVQAIVEGGSTYTTPAALYLPKMFGPSLLTAAGAHPFGDVTWTVDPAILTIPFGYDEGMFSVGTVAGPDIGPFWPVTPSMAIAFGPLATEVGGPFTVIANSPITAGEYDVYSVDAHGALEGPVGTATADGTTVTSTSLTPTILSWILFVPQA